MRLTADLSSAVELAKGARGTLRLIADDAATLTGTDGEVGVRVAIPDAEIGTAGECTLPALAAQVACEVGRLTVAVGKTLTLSDGVNVWEVPTEEDGAFDMPEPPDPTFTVDAETLSTALGRVAFAAAKADSDRYAARCVALDVDARGGRVVATDGKRLAVAELGECGAEVGAWLLPPRAVELIRRACQGAAAVALGDNEAFVTTPTGTVWCRLVEGRFAPWREVVPKGKATTIRLDAAAFARQVKLAALTTDTEARRVTLACDDQGVRMTAVGVPGRSAVTYTPLAFDGPPVTIDFDPGYLIDAAKVGDVLTLTLNGPQTSAVFRGEGVLYLVVPLV